MVTSIYLYERLPCGQSWCFSTLKLSAVKELAFRLSYLARKTLIYDMRPDQSCFPGVPPGGEGPGSGFVLPFAVR